MSETTTQTEQASNTGRFQVGERIIAMRYLIEGQRPFGCNPTFRPWEQKLTSKGVELVLLTVKEHHKVHSAHKPHTGEKKYDGYILEDQKSRRWTTQYPYASYGQLSDSADWYFGRQFPADADINDYVDLDLADFEDVTQVINRISRGIRHFGEEDNKLTEQERKDVQVMRAQLIVHRNWLIKKIEHEFGCKIEEKPIWKEAPHITQAVLIWPQ